MNPEFISGAAFGLTIAALGVGAYQIAWAQCVRHCQRIADSQQLDRVYAELAEGDKDHRAFGWMKKEVEGVGV